MSDELPDDYSQWPRDPYELLGVAHSVDAKDLKRAYTRLIRRFKPEQAPEHFRLIREAYESILGRLEFFSRFQFVAEDGILTPGSATESPEPMTAAEPEPTPPRPRDPLDDIWDEAARGDAAAAYQRLVEHASHSADAAVRAYWLLRVLPDLDRQRTPVEWLTRALAASNGRGPAKELLRRELLFVPEAASFDAVARLLEADLLPEVLAEVAEWRWRAAGSLDDAWLIIEDAAKLRDRLRAHEVTWARLLFIAADLLAFAGAAHREVDAEWCFEEIESLDHLHRELSFAFDRIDQLRVLAREWGGLRQRAANSLAAELVPIPRTKRILEMIPAIWSRPAEVLPRLAGLAGEIAADPRAWLDYLTRMWRTSPSVIECLAEGLRGLPAAPDSEHYPDSEDVAYVAPTLRLPSFWDQYEFRRGDYLAHCLERGLDPAWVAQVVSATGVTDNGGHSPGDVVAADTPLRLVYQATSWHLG